MTESVSQSSTPTTQNEELQKQVQAELLKLMVKDKAETTESTQTALGDIESSIDVSGPHLEKQKQDFKENLEVLKARGLTKEMFEAVLRDVIKAFPEAGDYNDAFVAAFVKECFPGKPENLSTAEDDEYVRVVFPAAEDGSGSQEVVLSRDQLSPEELHNLERVELNAYFNRLDKLHQFTRDWFDDPSDNIFGVIIRVESQPEALTNLLKAHEDQAPLCAAMIKSALDVPKFLLNQEAKPQFEKYLNDLGFHTFGDLPEGAQLFLEEGIAFKFPNGSLSPEKFRSTKIPDFMILGDDVESVVNSAASAPEAAPEVPNIIVETVIKKHPEIEGNITLDLPDGFDESTMNPDQQARYADAKAKIVESPEGLREGLKQDGMLKKYINYVHDTLKTEAPVKDFYQWAVKAEGGGGMYVMGTKLTDFFAKLRPLFSVFGEKDPADEQRVANIEANNPLGERLDKAASMSPEDLTKLRARMETLEGGGLQVADGYKLADLSENDWNVLNGIATSAEGSQNTRTILQWGIFTPGDMIAIHDNVVSGTITKVDEEGITITEDGEPKIEAKILKSDLMANSGYVEDLIQQTIDGERGEKIQEAAQKEAAEQAERDEVARVKEWLPKVGYHDITGRDTPMEVETSDYTYSQGGKELFSVRRWDTDRYTLYGTNGWGESNTTYEGAMKDLTVLGWFEEKMPDTDMFDMAKLTFGDTVGYDGTEIMAANVVSEYKKLGVDEDRIKHLLNTYASNGRYHRFKKTA